MARSRTIDKVVRNHLHRTASIVHSLKLDNDSILAIIEAIASLVYDADSITEFGEANSVAHGAETTVATYTVPVSKVFFLDGGIASGESDGKFRLKIDGVTKSLRRNNWTQRNVDFWPTIKVTAGQVVTITVENVAIDGSAADYSSTIFGRLLDEETP